MLTRLAVKQWLPPVHFRLWAHFRISSSPDCFQIPYIRIAFIDHLDNFKLGRPRNSENGVHMYNGEGNRFAYFILFFLNMLREWNETKLFFFIGYLRTGSGEGFVRTLWTPFGYATIKLSLVNCTLLRWSSPVCTLAIFDLYLLSCQPRVTVASYVVYKVITDLKSIDHLCIYSIRRIGLIHKWSIDSH